MMASPASVSIRVYRHPDDYQSVISLWKTAGQGIQLRRSDSSEEIEKKISRDGDLFLLAESDGRIIGSVIGGFDGRRGLIYHLAVDSSFRLNGIGTRLMEEVERRLKEKGCIKCYLLVTKENMSAMRFYEHRGWSSMETVSIFGKDL
jgi:ribosomal protein S18 acetylase RimI-like enzyme